MQKLSEFLSPGERKLVSKLFIAAGVLLLVLACSLFYWSFRLKAVRQEAVFLEKELSRIVEQIQSARTQFLSWRATLEDLDYFEKNLFYSGEDSLETFRQDLRRVFQQLGVVLPPISYNYDETSRKALKKLSASFNFRISYPLLKRFLYQVETWPRFLLLDQLNFQKIDNISGMLELRLTVSGFYHE